MTTSLFPAILTSTVRSPEIPPNDDLYGWLVGSWDLAIVSHDDEGVTRQSAGEVHVSRILEGRAVQDVFINPRRSDRKPSMAKFANWFGSTIRIYDPSISAWRIWWFNPYDGVRAELIGRREGDSIVQEGSFPDGTPIRWTFSEIRANSFLWRGERLDHDRNWRLQVEFRGRRMRAPVKTAVRSTSSPRGTPPGERARFSARRSGRRS
jgi:hypothetical protein